MARSSLVTGGAGFLGRYVLDALLALGSRPVVLDLPGRISGSDLIPVDLVKAPPDLGSMTPVIVYHLAGLAHVMSAKEADQRRFFEVNVKGTENLLRGLEAAHELPEALIFVSTVAVYGLQEGENLTEETPRRAIDPYGESKRRAEDLLFDWGQKLGVRVGIVRLPLVVGRNAPGNFGAMVSAIRRGRYVGIGSGKAQRSMVLATDVAMILPEVAARGGVFHLTDGDHPSFQELETSLSRALGRRPPRRIPIWAARVLARTGDALAGVGANAPFSSRVLGKMTSTLTFSDQRAREALGWSPSRVVDHAAETVG